MTEQSCSVDSSAPYSYDPLTWDPFLLLREEAAFCAACGVEIKCWVLGPMALSKLVERCLPLPLSDQDKKWLLAGVTNNFAGWTGYVLGHPVLVALNDPWCVGSITE